MIPDSLSKHQCIKSYISSHRERTNIPEGMTKPFFNIYTSDKGEILDILGNGYL